jgi:SAM-dependent methyltransferase
LTVVNQDESPLRRELTEIHAMSFGQAADLYDSARPSYPAEALAWAFGDRPCELVDVGAGTGLLTRGLISAGHRVTAVEPDKQMLDKLISVSPGLAGYHNSGAEDIPVPDSSVDAVAAGQAYHWFDPAKALPEFNRMLRPGGVFVPIWNVRDESVGWVKALTTIVGSSAAELTAVLATEAGYFAPHFDEPELKVFHHRKPMSAEGLVRLIKSRSYYLTADAGRKQEILAGVNDVIATDPQLAGKEIIEMPYTTHVFRMTAVKTA